MGLYRRGKIYWLSITQDSRRIQLSTRTSNKKQAEAIYAKVFSDLIEGRFFEKQKAQAITFREVAEKYMENNQKQRDTYSIKRLMPFFGDMTLARITIETVEGYIESRQNEGAAFSTIYKEFALGRRMFNVARKKWKWTKENPFADAEFPSFNNQRDRWLTMEEEERIIASAKQEWLKDIIIFAIHTGCRAGEILSVTWKDNIDLPRRCITIQSSKGGHKKSIPISNTLYDILTRKHKVGHISGRVFPIQQHTLKIAFRKVIKETGIEDLHFHDLRHTFATRLVQGGCEIYAVQTLLGHKTIKMTERYAHHCPESLRPSIAVLDNCYNSATATKNGTCHKGHKLLK